MAVRSDLAALGPQRAAQGLGLGGGDLLGRGLQQALGLGQLGAEAGQDLAGGLHAARRAHQLLLQLPDAPQH